MNNKKHNLSIKTEKTNSSVANDSEYYMLYDSFDKPKPPNHHEQSYEFIQKQFLKALNKALLKAQQKLDNNPIEIADYNKMIAEVYGMRKESKHAIQLKRLKSRTCRGWFRIEEITKLQEKILSKTQDKTAFLSDLSQKPKL